jgi:hypothetical protein
MVPSADIFALPTLSKASQGIGWLLLSVAATARFVVNVNPSIVSSTCRKDINTASC